MVTLPLFSATRSALFAGVISILVLAGCANPTGTPIIQTQINEISVPAAQENCPRLPVPPDPDDPETTQRDVALYVAELVDVAEHCRGDLYTLNRIIREYNALAAKSNADSASQ